MQSVFWQLDSAQLFSRVKGQEGKIGDVLDFLFFFEVGISA